jgi:spore germination cell wall hydrolase CwlJ-like protein
MKEITIHTTRRALATGFLALALFIIVLAGLLIQIERELDEARSDIARLEQANRELAAQIALSHVRRDIHRQHYERELDCLARNIFFEAGVESWAGKLAVAQVTQNRVNTGRWGRSICEAVYHPRQFSWTAQAQKEPHGALWEESLAAAEAFMAGERVPELAGALFYHADYVDPYWAGNKVQVAQVGRHIYYEPRRK